MHMYQRSRTRAKEPEHFANMSGGASADKVTTIVTVADKPCRVDFELMQREILLS